MNIFYFLLATDTEPEQGYTLLSQSWMDKALRNLVWSLS